MEQLTEQQRATCQIGTKVKLNGVAVNLFVPDTFKSCRNLQKKWQYFGQFEVNSKN